MDPLHCVLANPASDAMALERARLVELIRAEDLDLLSETAAANTSAPSNPPRTAGAAEFRQMFAAAGRRLTRSVVGGSDFMTSRRRHRGLAKHAPARDHAQGVSS